jgi:hypothetical protein
MRLLPTILTASLLGSLLTACASAGARRSAADEASDRAELLRLHEQARTAHVDRRADLLVSSQADTLLSVSGGRISMSTRDAVRSSFQEYFDQSTFQAWDDVTPPRIRISPDGQMAYVVVDKRVHVTMTPAPGAAPVVERVRYAWLSVYEKRNGEWRMTAIASTERPDST